MEVKGKVRKHEHMSLEGLAAVEDMATTAQRGMAERIRVDLEINCSMGIFMTPGSAARELGS